MTGRGHQIFGFYGAMLAYPISLDYELNALLISLGLILGARAPDYLEIRVKNRTLIPHRGITHHLLIWLALLAYFAGSISLFPMGDIPTLNKDFSSVLFGFSLGGLLHLLLDIPNPMGVPFARLKDRFTLNLWKSGEFELPLHVMAIVGLILFFLPSTFFVQVKELITQA